jgi:hypothetical protein
MDASLLDLCTKADIPVLPQQIHVRYLESCFLESITLSMYDSTESCDHLIIPGPPNA